jgi:hypothetical protein
MSSLCTSLRVSCRHRKFAPKNYLVDGLLCSAFSGFLYRQRKKTILADCPEEGVFFGQLPSYLCIYTVMFLRGSPSWSALCTADFLSIVPFQGSWWEVYSWGSLLGLWLFLCTWLWRRRQAGILLLDLGRVRQTQWFGGVGLLLLLGGGLLLVTSLRTADFDRKVVLLCVLLSSLGSLLVSMWLSRVEIRTKGIWSFGCLIPWASIFSYEWTTKRGEILVLKLRGPVWSFAVRYPLTATAKEDIEHLFAQYLARGGSKTQDSL